ncbi:hypothetical protein TanjilG_06792 [Lupinus angustifolius]|uniref:Amino acid transporter transmembrane domain-containing protein n=1 Tax=Lupinus angustifolius TaxID=3871 RepID=A0A394DFD9_LUPAN|nr:hypothetical protein TanjilG_06792 [Lupinus angustifolius]
MVRWWQRQGAEHFPTTRLLSRVPSLLFFVHTIDNELEDSSQIQGVVRNSLALCSSVYLLISFFGFLLFVEGTLNDVLANFDIDLGIPFSAVLNDVVRLSYAAYLMLVFPVVFFSLRLSIDGLLFSKSRPLVLDNFRFASLTISLIGVIFLGANLSMIISSKLPLGK